MSENTETTRWWFVRHAPVLDVVGLIYGADDVACDTSDRPAFEVLAQTLPARAVWMTSHLSRTVKTAAAIRAAGLDFPEAVVEPDIGEQNFGDWQGRSWDQMQADDPEGYATFWQTPARSAPPGGESFADLIDRAGRVIDRYTRDHAGRDIVAVCHGGTIRAALAHVLGLPPETGMAISVGTLSMTRVEHVPGGLLKGRGGAWRVTGVNIPAGHPNGGKP